MKFCRHMKSATDSTEISSRCEPLIFLPSNKTIFEYLREMSACFGLLFLRTRSEVLAKARELFQTASLCIIWNRLGDFVARLRKQTAWLRGLVQPDRWEFAANRKDSQPSGSDVQKGKYEERVVLVTHAVQRQKARREWRMVALVAGVGAQLLFTNQVNAGADPLPQTSLSAPDGRIVITIKSNGILTYSVTVDGRPVLNESRLGLRLRDGTEFGREVELLRTSFCSVDTTWDNPNGKRRLVRDKHNELRCTFAERSAGGKTFELIFRAFNDGAGFRYVLPAQPGMTGFVLDEELTQFAFPSDYLCFTGEQEKGFSGPQEFQFLRRQLSYIKPESIVGLPLLVKTPLAWVALTESDLLDWSGMWLGRSPGDFGSGVTLTTKLAPLSAGRGLVRAVVPHNSPWRVIMIGREPGRLIESDLVLNLATPCQLADTSWVRPGMMAWDHWWTGNVKMDTATIKQYIQLAADMGWPYQLIDWQWYGEFDKPNSCITNVNPSVNMMEIRKFAQAKNVRLWLWLHWRDVLRNQAYRAAFPLYEEWGIAGVKIDGVGDNALDTDDQEAVNSYETLTRAAAACHLMVNFHHAYKPTGLERTLPNQITREGILGNEYYRATNVVTPLHKVTLPFTRFLAGPGDFTPGGFVNRQPDQFRVNGQRTEVQGTRASELALFVAYFSPVCCACDRPAHYYNQAGADFLKIVPTVWDETRVLAGEPGEHLVIARQSGRDWFLGALTDSAPREETVKLDFLGPGKWKMRLWRDTPDSAINAEHLEIIERQITASDVLNLHLAPAGGAVAHFIPVRDLGP